MNGIGLQRMSAIVVILLVLSLPFYSASSLAATISVTKNSGTAEVEGFLDGNGDTWTLEALVAGVSGSVTPTDVRLQVGSNDLPFASCASSVGGQLCTYTQSIEYVPESAYPFSVAYRAEESTPARSTITADGTAPRITVHKLEQREGSLFLDATVTDDPSSAAGLQEMIVTDLDTQQVLLGITDGVEGFTLGQKEYRYTKVLPVSFSGEGVRRLSIAAKDQLGHESSVPKSISTDFIAPAIQTGTLSFTGGEFVGQVMRTVTMAIDIRETSDLNNLQGVTASSAQMEFTNNKAVCTNDAVEPGLKHCTWASVQMAPESSVSVLVRAVDSSGNPQEVTIQKTFTPDVTAPVVEFFGTQRTFAGQSIIKQGENTLLLRVRDDGAGVLQDGIRAELGAFAGKGNYELPDECTEEGDVLTCTWKVSFTQRTTAARASLTKFTDAVGNEGTHEAVELVVDGVAPEVEGVEVVAIGDVGERNYFQSHDLLRLKLKIREEHGLFMALDLRDLINDAITLFPNGAFNDAGWKVFTEEDCDESRDAEGRWVCSLDITEDALKSGTGASEEFTIHVEDTAGNIAENYPASANVRLVEADEGTYSLELLGVVGDPDPDYWQVDSRNIEEHGFIDLGTTQLLYPRLSVAIPFRSDAATALAINLADCIPEREGLTIRRPVLYRGELDSSAITPTVVLEFEQFNAKTVFPELPAEADDEEFRAVDVPVNCQFLIYSQIGENALENAEIQAVNLSLPFGYSENGELAENIDEKVQEARDDAFTDFAITMADLRNIVQWLETFNDAVIRPLLFILEIINAAKASTDLVPDAFGRALLCGGLTDTQSTLEDVIQWLQVPSALLSCSATSIPGPYNDLIGEWQQEQLADYNDFFLAGTSDLWEDDPQLERALRPALAASPRDNIVSSAVTLCLPGIIENLEKWGDIQCRYIYCLENEVAQGLPISVCAEMKDQLLCKYWWGGQVVGNFPIVAPFSNLVQSIKTAIQDPIGTGLSLLWANCHSACAGGSTISAACTATDITRRLISQFSGIVNALDVGFGTGVEADYCSRIEE